MKTLNFLIFFAVFFTVYGLINFYIGLRGWQAMPPDAPWRPYYLPVFVGVSLSFVAGRFLERVWLSPVSAFLVWTGSFWLAAMAYLFLAVVLLDLLRLSHAIIPWFPEVVTRDYARARYVAGLAVAGAVLVLIIAGAVNAAVPEVRRLRLEVDKALRGRDTLHIAVVSDIHLGTIIGNLRLGWIAGRINDLRPDLILLAGDIVDEDLGPVIRQNLGEHLRDLHAPLGVYAITGNHEYIGGVEEAVAYLVDHGVTVLRDSSVRLDNGLTIVGREDRSIRQFSGRVRKPLGELLGGVDRSGPIILMDHQPFGLEESAAAGVDIQLSGHTHHGQLWPFNLITRAIYEVSWGYARKLSTHIYVSSGVGTWGPPVRTSSRPEIVSMTLVCRQAAQRP